MRAKSLMFGFLMSVMAFAFPVDGNARVHKGYDTTSSGALSMVVDSVDYREDLTRVYGKLVGSPHTSNRIDDMVLMDNGKPAVSTDIDGVDMKRWFQWEDEGLINVEIDFPALKKAGTLIIKVSGPKGESVWTARKRGVSK